MEFTATAKYLPVSPYKLRPLADVIRGKSAVYARAWCAAYKTRKMMPLLKVLNSAIANAVQQGNVAVHELKVKKICVDQGRIQRYFKPGAQGRAMVQRRRASHISVVLSVEGKEARSGSKG